VKSPRFYVADSGLLHALLGIEEMEDLEGHPAVGASWEGFALGEVVARLRARWNDCYFWATHGGAELDLLVVRGRRRLGFEFKRTSSPALTRSIHVATEDLGLESLHLVYPGPETFRLAKTVRALSLRRLEVDLEPL
jgi:uncharacterized protein